MHEKSICSYCGDDQSPVQTRFFYQVTVEQILAGMELIILVVFSRLVVQGLFVSGMGVAWDSE